MCSLSCENWTPKWSYSSLFLDCFLSICLLDCVLFTRWCQQSEFLDTAFSENKLSLLYINSQENVFINSSIVNFSLQRRRLPWITLLISFLFVAWYSILSIRSCRFYSTIIRIVSCRPGRVVIYLVGKRHSLLLAVGAKIVRVASNCEKEEVAQIDSQ